MASPESAKKLFGPDPYQFLNFLDHLHLDDDSDLHQQAKTLFNYTKKQYPDTLIRKLLETIQKNPLKLPRIRSYYLLRDIIPAVWPERTLALLNDLKSKLNSKLWLEKDEQTLRACASSVSSLAALLLPNNEWDMLFNLMFVNLGTTTWNKKLAALLLWNDLIPKCHEVFAPYVDSLTQHFMDLMPTVPEDNRCGVAAARVSVKLILYYGNLSNDARFYDLLGFAIMTLFHSLGEEDLVCGLLEDLVVLAGVQTALFADHNHVFESMVRIADNLEFGERLRQLAIEFVITVSEDKESGSGIMQNVDKTQVFKLLNALIVMLVHIEDDPNWGKATSDDSNVGELSLCGYAMETLGRLTNALGGDIVLSNCPSCLFDFFHDQDWRIRHAAITAIGIISEGCSKALLNNMRREMGQLVEAMMKLIHDRNPRVRWATIHTIGQFSKYLTPDFQEQYHQHLLPALIEVLDNFDNPRLQDYASIYDSTIPYVNVTFVSASEDEGRMLVAKCVECITMILEAAGKQAMFDMVEKATKAIILLQDTQMEVEDPIRSLLLQAWGRLCKFLGSNFLPCLDVAMPFVLTSAQLMNFLSVSNDSDDESMTNVSVGESEIGLSSSLLEEKVLACHTLCCFAAELNEGLHLWVNEVVSALIPIVTLKISEEARLAAISAMPLLLLSASCAVKKGLPVAGCGEPPVQKLFDKIIPALLDAVMKESKIHIQARLLQAFDESIQIPGSRLSKQHAAKFVEIISEVISTFSYQKTEREKRAKKHKDLREQEHKKAEQHLTICRNIGTCLGTMVKILDASFLPLFDKFLPNVSLMWSNDKTAEVRRILVQLFRDVAEKHREEAFRYYEKWISHMLKLYNHNDPDVQQLVATGIGICAEFGGDFLKPRVLAIYNYLESVIEHPDAKTADNILAYEAAVSTCGKLSHFVCEGRYTDKFILLWLSNLPIMCNLEEAKISHQQLCLLLETSEKKVIGPQGSYLPHIITIFSEVLWAGNNLATEETRTQMIKLLKKFKRELQPGVFSDICSTLPLPHQNMLHAICLF